MAENKDKVVTFGELMLRLAPEGYLRFVQADKLGATYGGGEANVAVSLANYLANYGHDAHFVSKLPKHEIGQAALNSLRKYGVNTDDIVRGGDRVGIYFLEKGASQRPSKVIYDRAGSAIATAKKEEFDWKEILKDARWFHTTGITPALNDETAAMTLEALKTARELGVPTSMDLNYRNKLWSKEKAGKVMDELCRYVDVVIANEEDAKDVFGIEAENTDITARELGVPTSMDLNYRNKLWSKEKAGKVMDELCRYVDVVIANEEDAKDVFGIEAENTDIHGGKIDREGYKEVAKKLKDRFGFDKVAITLRESINANRNLWSAMLYDGDDYHFSKKYDMNIGGKIDREGYKEVAKKLKDRFGFDKVAITLRESINANRNLWSAMLYDGDDYHFSKKYDMNIVDRVGGGDSFGGGLIHALMKGMDSQDAIEFAVAASALKHSIEGDYNLVSEDEVLKLAGGDASGRVQR